jgi:RHH-type proline utilization regulon transcriptional repressor/proline dehydrogenase/delta 1-pyrroline-5-carboxylate dehydrogenase
MATACFAHWQGTAVEERAQSVERLADLCEANAAELIALCHREAGKTLSDALAEIREAVDFCRYYASRARVDLAPFSYRRFDGVDQPSRRVGRGVFVCISPWNFPLAIFLGQISAALVTGNCVIAKPAEQTPLIASRAVALALQAGVPAGALQLLPGSGTVVGAALTTSAHIDGVIFTGSTDTARIINRALAQHPAGPLPFIAETGGQNTMLVDSTALPEQVVADVVRSAFSSAGQRCSALRVLYVQQDIAEDLLRMLAGAMAELVVGDPSQLRTDVGPIIDREAQEDLLSHVAALRVKARLIAEAPLPDSARHGTFVAPVAFEIGSISDLDREHFGPILHVVRYRIADLDRILDEINATGYGLTLGVHSRNQRMAHHIAARIKAGNAYINRDQVGAVVGVQPFGGQGLSGTGPKAGGPHYLQRLTRPCDA